MRPGDLIVAKPYSTVGIKAQESSLTYELVKPGAVFLVVASNVTYEELVMVLATTGQLGWVLKFYFDTLRRVASATSDPNRIK